MHVSYCNVFSFLWRSIQAVGCFFDCFGVRNDRRKTRHRLIPNSSSSYATEGVKGKIQVSNSFVTEEEEECVVNEQENLLQQSVSRSEIDDGLLEEVQLLKACGTLPETPAEIRKAVKFSEQVETSDMKFPLRALHFSPHTPALFHSEEIGDETSQSENSGNYCSGVESSPETPEEMQKLDFASGISEKSDVQGRRSMLKALPYPTPQKITDDMQTPGTVYATNMKSLTVGNARIRCQYVYTVLNPISSSHQLDEEENLVQPGDITPLPAKVSNGKCVNEETEGDVSLSSWLKPLLGNDGNDRHNQEAASMRQPNIRDTPGDRPVVGLNIVHWNEHNETPHIPPKWEAGNGIPNTTTKYKEDQKVRWHATPFEKRLEKALSEETRVPQRMPVTGPRIILEEMDSQDTGTATTSQLLTSPKSVVSF